MFKIFEFTSRTNVLKDFIVVFIIFLSPFLFFLYMLSPVGLTEWKTSYFHFKINFSNYEIITALWYFSSKFYITLIFCLWFVTCKYWWRYLIFVPLLFEVNKFVSFYYQLNYESQDYKILYSLIVSVPLIFILLFVSKMLNYYSLSKSINKQIDDEINVLMKHVSNYKTEDYKEYKTKLVLLRKQKINMVKKEYLIKLIKLREDFSLNPENK